MNGALRTASVLATAVLALSIASLLPLHALLARGRVGVALQVFAILLLLWARLTFGMRSFHAAANPTAGGLVTTGPYHFIRHPIYAGVLLFTWTACLSHLSIKTLAVAVFASCATAVRIAAEEHLVVQRYPEYREYARKTSRLIPGIL